MAERSEKLRLLAPLRMLLMRIVISTWLAMAINTKHNAVYLCVLLTLSERFKSLISVYMRANHTYAVEAVSALLSSNVASSRGILPQCKR